MKINKKLIAATSAIVFSLSLTACDPPMPPDVVAQILEQSYTCEEGNVTASLPTDMADLGLQWADSLSGSCVDPLAVMTLELVDAKATPDLYVNAYAPDSNICKPTFTVPFAIEAADVVFQLADSSTLNLSPKTLAAVLNGEITNWNDPAIADDNVGTTFPDLAIKVNKKADQLALGAMTNWMTILKQDISKSGIEPVVAAELPTLSEGEIAIAPHSQVVAVGIYAASIVTGINNETGEQILAVADSIGIAAGASQLVAKKDATSVAVALDPTLEVIAQAGLDEAAPPYQAIYPVNLYACGEESLLKHAMALYLLRLDSQGALSASNFNPLAEAVRFESLDVARKGLPTPAPVAE